MPIPISAALVVGLALLAQVQAKPDPDQFPLALHRSMEIDDLDREIQRLHDSVLLKRSQLATTQRLAQRGAASRTDIEREVASLHYEEGREVEARAYREIKLYERDVNGHVIPPDEQKAYALILTWIKAQEAIGQVDVDYRGFLLKQTQALYQRKAVTRQELEDAELSYDMAVASVALSHSREAQVMLELAARKGEKKYDASEYEKLKAAYVQARIRYFELSAALAERRYDIARERSRRGLIPPNELPLFEKSLAEANEALEAERRKLDKPDAAPASESGSAPASASASANPSPRD
jgi:outer membrane protein TolC